MYPGPMGTIRLYRESLLLRRVETHCVAKICAPMGAQRDGAPNMIGTPIVAPAASCGTQHGQSGVGWCRGTTVEAAQEARERQG